MDFPVPDYVAVRAEHVAADKACGREWVCACGACRIIRARLKKGLTKTQLAALTVLAAPGAMFYAWADINHFSGLIAWPGHSRVKMTRTTYNALLDLGTLDEITAQSDWRRKVYVISAFGREMLG